MRAISMTNAKSSNPYGARCYGWVPEIPKKKTLSKKEQDAVERNLTIEEQNFIPEGTICTFYDMLTMKCDYWLNKTGECKYRGQK